MNGVKKKLKDKKIVNLHRGRGNLSATIFVPSDCTNNCKFCTSKESYKERQPNIEKVLKSIRKLNKVGWVESFVLTGGEPFADLDILSIILSEISPSKKVYVNTTLPTNKYSENELANFINNSRIDGVNISRHATTYEKDQAFFSKNIASDSIVEKIERPIKINHLATNGENVKKVVDRWSKYSNVIVSLRADYRKVTKASLKDLTDDLTNEILNIPGVTYVSHGGCDVCFDIVFCYDGRFYFSLHRGMEYSSILFGNELIINDIIVSQDGDIYYDWDMNTSKLKVKKGILKIKKEN